MTVTVALGTTAPDGSVTVPSSVPLTACPMSTCENASTNRAVMDPRMGLTTLFNVIISASKLFDFDPIRSSYGLKIERTLRLNLSQYGAPAHLRYTAPSL